MKTMRKGCRRAMWSLVGAVVLMVVLGCGGDSQPVEMKTHKGDYPYTIVATVGMVADIARHVAGDHAQVTSLIGEGIDPHLHDPTRKDMRDLLDADVVLYSGLHLEGRMVDSFEEFKDSGKPVFAVSAGVDRDKLIQPSDDAEHADPHLWMDVSLWIEGTRHIAESLGKYDPANRSSYLENAEAYIEELEKLDRYVRDAVKTIPEQQRVLITAHDAFAYFGRAYGIEVMAPQGISTESEASVEDINKLVRTIVDRKVGAIFVESSVNPKTISAVIEGVADRGHQVKIGGTLFSDAMGAAGSYEGTYIGMIDHNATVIVDALGGQVDERGMNGRLGDED